MAKPFLSLFAALVIASASCNGGGTAAVTPGPQTSAPAPPCSAAILAPKPPEQDLPEQVAEMREDISSAAVACDYDTLDRLAREGGSEFSYTFGEGDSSPGAYWRRLEGEALRDKNLDAPLAMLVNVLSVPYAITTIPPPEGGSETRVFVWPAIAAREKPAEADWTALEDVYPRERIAAMRKTYDENGVTYLDWRAGITEAGDWIYFVAGD